MYLTCEQPALSQTNSFKPVMRVPQTSIFCDGFHFDVTQTARVEKISLALVSSEQLFAWAGTETRKHGVDLFPASGRRLSADLS